MHFDLVTPAHLFYEGEIDYAQIPLHDGLMGILPGHSPLVALLGFGLCTVRKDGQEKLFVIDGGFVEVQPNRLTMLANHAEELIDVDRKQAEVALATALQEQPVGDVAIQNRMERIAAARTRMKYAHLD
ncbi:MAG: ATP synthase F1 subunit epsilon [Leptospiraceae bacterium]|nr:ATP synthase F1 subunit epsilon [Leptospiraceae bacterium]